VTSSLPRKYSTAELCGHKFTIPTPSLLERAMGIEPTLSAWKAEVLPLNYARTQNHKRENCFKSIRLSSSINGALSFIASILEGVGFEPTKAKPSDLQSDPFDRSGTPPKIALNCPSGANRCQPPLRIFPLKFRGLCDC
jgi:hypothetical protein